MDFTKFKSAVARQFERMTHHPLFRVEVDKDLLWSTYLASFPPGTNLVYRERREYDCSCCRQFVRAVGDVVAIVGDEVVSIWDAFDIYEPAYQAVADAMAALVKSRPIANVFLTTERTAGTERTFEQIQGEMPHTWNHFYINIPQQYVWSGAGIGPMLSETRALHDVLYRSLEEINNDAVNTALELIAQNSLYRGAEHKVTLETFRNLKHSYCDQMGVALRHAFVWRALSTLPPAVSRIRNTAIGTLLVDLSSGMDLDEAVSRFESVVAPANYKRPTALVTPKMVQLAKLKLENLGLISALERRYARLEDVSPNNVLFADRSARKVIEPDAFDGLSMRVAVPRTYSKAERIGIEKFVKDILPRAESVEVMFENRHASNLVSLVAPVDPTANKLFKWDNHFSWSYAGDLADSVKERVKKAGGNVTGDLCCRLAWYNHDDLDLHMREPGGHEIYYNNRGPSLCGGRLDVDMNAGSGRTRTPVENIYYERRAAMREGEYQLFVHNFCRREFKDTGFEVELDWLGSVTRFAYAKPVRDDEWIVVAKLKYTKANGVEILESLPSSQTSRIVWGLATQQFHRVNVMMLSPNYWGDHPTGNKHYFFMLADCRNDGQARGFYNEFLKPELNVHRKVIEMVGSKMKTEESPDQLSGLGFSSTQPTDLLVRVKGAFTRTINVTF